MTLPHSAVKLAAVAVGIVAAAIYAMDPTVKVFIIAMAVASITPTIAGMFNVVLHIMDRRERKADKKAAEEQAVLDKRKADADQRSLHASIGEVKKTVEAVEVNTNSKLTELLAQRNTAMKKADILEGSEAGRQLARTEAAEDRSKKEG